MKLSDTPVCSSCPRRKGPLLSCCQPAELEMLFGSKVSQAYRKGQAIFREGSATLGTHCVRERRIKVTQASGDGKEQIVRLAKGGSMLGARSLLAGTRYSTSAVALDDCVVCFVPRPDFLRLVQSSVPSAASLMQQLAQSLGEAEQGMLHLAYKPVRERLAGALLLLRTFQPEGEEAPFSIALSRDDLAALVGIAKKTATRLLSELRGEGIIDTHGSRITVPAPERLVRIASQYDAAGAMSGQRQRRPVRTAGQRSAANQRFAFKR